MRLSLLLALSTTAFLLSSCNRTHTSVIAVIPKANENVFWQTVHAGVVKASWDNGIEAIWEGPAAETDIAGEMQIVETMIDRQVDAIVLAPSDKTAFKIVVDRAAAARIPVVIYDSAVESDRYATFVATDNYAGGAMGGDRLGERLHGGGAVVMVKTNPGGASTVARETGFRDELTKRFPRIAIVDERFGMANVAQSRTVAENMLTAHPEIKGIFASSETAAEGAALALQARGLHLTLVGFDSSPALLAMMQTGAIDSLVIQDPFRMGETAFNEAVKAMRGEAVPKLIALPPHVLDVGNFNLPSMRRQLFPDLKKYLGS